MIHPTIFNSTVVIKTYYLTQLSNQNLKWTKGTGSHNSSVNDGSLKTRENLATTIFEVIKRILKMILSATEKIITNSWENGLKKGSKREWCLALNICLFFMVMNSYSVGALTVKILVVQSYQRIFATLQKNGIQNR